VAAVSCVLQQTLVVSARPTIQRDLDTIRTCATWVFTGFLLTSAILTSLMGTLGGMYGEKRMLVVALGLFAAGTLAAAPAGSIALLIAARALQGVGGARSLTFSEAPLGHEPARGRHLPRC
jgi:MFS family permease